MINPVSSIYMPSLWCPRSPESHLGALLAHHLVLVHQLHILRLDRRPVLLEVRRKSKALRVPPELKVRLHQLMQKHPGWYVDLRVPGGRAHRLRPDAVAVAVIVQLHGRAASSNRAAWALPARPRRLRKRHLEPLPKHCRRVNLQSICCSPLSTWQALQSETGGDVRGSTAFGWR